MLSDLVVDTNVFVHAQNPAEQRFQDALNFLHKLLECDSKIGIDKLFSAGSQNTSLIGQEYLDNLTPTGFGYAVLVAMLQSGRIKMDIPTRVPADVRRLVMREIPRNKRDRTFAFVTYNTMDRFLVSHDFSDFTQDVRNRLKDRLDIKIEEAFEALEQLE
jgi:hypothetical protein